MIHLNDYLYNKIISVMQQWDEKDIYSITFFIYKNENIKYKNHRNIPSFAIGYNTESYFQEIYDEDQDEYEQRYNYAYLQQNEYEILDDEGLDVFFEWYEANYFESDLEYLKLLDVTEKVGVQIQENDELLKLFDKRIPIIVQSLEETKTLRKLTQTINIHGEASDYLNYYFDSSVINLDSLEKNGLSLIEFERIEKDIIKSFNDGKFVKQKSKSLKKCIKRSGEAIAIDKEENLIYVASPMRVFVYDLDNYDLLYDVKVLNNITDIFLSHDCKLLAVKNNSGHIAVVDLKTRSIIYEDNQERNSDKAFFSNDDQYIYISDDYGAIHKIDILSGSFIDINQKKNDGMKTRIKNGIFYYDDQDDLLIYYWNKEKIILDSAGNIVSVESVASKVYKELKTSRNFSITRHYIVLCEDNYTLSHGQHELNVYDRKTFERIKKRTIDAGYECLISDDEKYIAVTGVNRTVIYELETLLEIKEYNEFAWVLSFEHSSKNKEMYIGSDTGIYIDYDY